jgi:serine/threonine-protein kinase
VSDTNRIGKYEVQAALGKGPHGTVYRALDTQFDRLVAIKVMPREGLNPKALEPFRKYSAGLVRLRHPGIARFIEAIETAKTLCLVWELAEGRPLASQLRDGAYPEPRNAWDIARQMLEALAYAHGQGAAHRDLKPQNVMLAPNGAVTLTDFGTAMLHASPGEAVHYRAPEQFEGGKVTPATDIYQLGAIVYQLVTGKLPFTGTPEEVAHRVLQERPTDPSSYNNRLAWQLDWVVQKALSKDPSERFASAVDFAEGLRLGLQDTVGVPLEPARAPATAPAPRAEPAKAAPAPAAATLVQNAKAIAKPAAQAPQPAPVRTPVTPPHPVPPAAKATAPARPAAKPTAPAQPEAKAPPSAPAPTPVAPKPPAAAAKPRILFVDDDARLLNGLRTTFKQDYDVVTAENGDAALELVKQGGLHVVVSDQRMPGLTGVELLRKVRAIAPDTVRILLTGYTDLAALVGSINEGEIFRFVKKPWDGDELKTALADAAKIALELAATPPPKPASPRSAGSILVIDPGAGIARGLERLLAGGAVVHHVQAPQEAVRVLARGHIAAIVADMGSGMDGLVALFKELKAKRPEVLTILLTDQPDSELAIELVNKAQIYRFLPKPVNARELRTQVAMALRRYAAFKQIPTLREPAAGAGPASALAERARAQPERAVARNG